MKLYLEITDNDLIERSQGKPAGEITYSDFIASIRDFYAKTTQIVLIREGNAFTIRKKYRKTNWIGKDLLK